MIETPTLLFASAMNLPYEGGGFQFCPEADSKDDHLDLILVEKMPKLKVFLLLPTAFFGKHTRFRGIHIHTFRGSPSYHGAAAFSYIPTARSLERPAKWSGWLLPEALTMIL